MAVSVEDVLRTLVTKLTSSEPELREVDPEAAEVMTKGRKEVDDLLERGDLDAASASADALRKALLEYPLIMSVMAGRAVPDEADHEDQGLAQTGDAIGYFENEFMDGIGRNLRHG